MFEPPAICVVVPTRRRETRLAFLLEALAGQRLDPGRFEIVVVRDGAWGGPLADAPEGVDVRFLRHEGAGGPAACRNLGWRAARAPLVAFCDDDCRPSPAWLEELLRAAEGADVIVQGRTEPDPDEWHLLGGLARSQLIDGPSDWYQTCNIAYPRALLDRLGGFDESFTGAFGEDTDLGLRAVSQGARRRFAPGALAWHAVHPRHVHTAVREARRWEVVPRLIERYPELRRAIYSRFFWKEAHAKLSLATAGGLAARRHPLVAVAAAAPYVALHLRTYDRSPRGRARAALDLPSRVLADGAELLAVARGALRARTLVL